MLSQVARLVAGAALHLDATPMSEGLAQALVAVDDQQERLGQASPLQTNDHLGPVDLRLAGRDAQRHQHLLAVLPHAERRQDGHAHNAPSQSYLEVEAIEEQHRVGLARQIPLAPRREQFLEPRHHPRHRALGQMFFTQQGLQRQPNPSAVRTRQVAAQDRFVDLARPPRVARQDLAAELLGRAVPLFHPTPRYPQLPRSDHRCEPPHLDAVAVPSPPHRALVALRTQCLAQLLSQDDLDRLQQPLQEQIADPPPELQHLSRDSFLHGVTSFAGGTAKRLANKRLRHFQFPRRSGRILAGEAQTFPPRWSATLNAKCA